MRVCYTYCPEKSLYLIHFWFLSRRYSIRNASANWSFYDKKRFNKQILIIHLNYIHLTGFELYFPCNSINDITVKLTRSISRYSKVAEEILFNGHHPSISLRILFEEEKEKIQLNIFPLILPCFWWTSIFICITTCWKSRI